MTYALPDNAGAHAGDDTSNAANCTQCSDRTEQDPALGEAEDPVAQEELGDYGDNGCAHCLVERSVSFGSKSGKQLLKGHREGYLPACSGEELNLAC